MKSDSYSTTFDNSLRVQTQFKHTYSMFVLVSKDFCSEKVRHLCFLCLNLLFFKWVNYFYYFLLHPSLGPVTKLFDHLHLGPRYGRVNLHVHRVCFLIGGHVGGIKEVFEIFPPSTHKVPSWGQQHTIFTIHCVERALLSPPEKLDGEPDKK